MKSRLHVVLAGLLLAAGLLHARDAPSYKRTETCDSFGTYECRPGESPKPIAWPVRCVRYRINDRGSNDFGSGDRLSNELENLVVQSFDTWNEPSCSDFHLVQGPETSNAKAEYRKDAGFDGNMNLVVWRDNQWPYPQSRWAFALTSVTYSAERGTITDADIELNSDRYDFTYLSESQVRADDPGVDLSNTLTHEVGHFVGLDHPQNEDATMYGKAPPGEISKRTLHQDDIDGLCAIYPKQSPRANCNQPEDFTPPEPLQEKKDDRPACSTVGTGADRLPVAAVWVLALLAGGGWRRYRKRDDGDP